MQIIEVTDIAGVRSAVHTFGSRSTPLRFVVFPMVHLAEATFYESVTARLRSCDLVVAEGMSGSSLRVRALSGSYRWLKSSDRLKLTLQQINYSSLGVPTLYPDMAADEFDRSWRQIPRVQSLALWFILPLYVIGMRLFGTRRFIASNLEMDNLATEDEIRASDHFKAIDDLLGNERDRRLLSALASIHHDRSDEPIRVAVVYGAGHVRAIVAGLLALGYRSRGAEWLTVFKLDHTNR
jgi:hypothetical protein